MTFLKGSDFMLDQDKNLRLVVQKMRGRGYCCPRSEYGPTLGCYGQISGYQLFGKNCSP